MNLLRHHLRVVLIIIYLSLLVFGDRNSLRNILAQTDDEGNTSFSSVYIGGQFESNGDGTTNLKHIARLKLDNTWGQVNNSLDDDIFDLALSNEGILYAAGRFQWGVAKLNPISNTWESVGDCDELSDCLYRDIEFDANGTVYVAGSPLGGGTDVYKLTENNTWQLVGESLVDDIIDIEFYAEGEFYAAGIPFGQGALGTVFKLSNDSWQPLGDGTEFAIYDIELDDNGELFIAAITEYEGDVVYGVFRLDTNNDTWEAVGENYNRGGRVTSLLVSPSGELYAGGWFSERIVQLDIVTNMWEVVGNASTLGVIDTLAARDYGTLYAGGVGTIAVYNPISQEWDSLGNGLFYTQNTLPTVFAIVPTVYDYDANDDGKISPVDAIYVINRIGDPKDETNAAADVDGNGSIDAADATAVIEAIGQTVDSPTQ